MSNASTHDTSDLPEPKPAAKQDREPKAPGRGRVVPEIPDRLAALQKELVATEVAVIVARRNRNVEVAKLRDEAKMSQYRIAKWLGVTERAVMLMAQQGRENPTG